MLYIAILQILKPILMKQIKVIGILLILGLVSFTSCESVDGAQKVADNFFQAFNNQDEKAMETILDQEFIIDAGIKDDFYDVFDQHASALGNIKEYERYAFSTNINNGVTTVTLKFKCETDKKNPVYEKLKFVQRGEDYKVIAFQYNTDKSAIDNEEK